MVRGGTGLVCVEGEGGVLTGQTVFTPSVCSRLTVGSEISSLAGRAQAFSHTVCSSPSSILTLGL